MLLMDGPVGPGDGRLDVAKRGVAPRERRHTGRGGAGAGLGPLMLAARLFHRPETGQTIADHLAVRIQAAFREPRNGMIAEAGDPAQLQAHRLALGRGLDRSHERRFARGATTTLATGALAAQIGARPAKLAVWHPC